MFLVCENRSGHSATIKQFLAIGSFMLTFGHLKGEKTGFSVITFLRKIITYSQNDFRIAHHLFCLFVLFYGN